MSFTRPDVIQRIPIAIDHAAFTPATGFAS